MILRRKPDHVFFFIATAQAARLDVVILEVLRGFWLLGQTAADKFSVDACIIHVARWPLIQVGELEALPESQVLRGFVNYTLATCC